LTKWMYTQKIEAKASPNESEIRISKTREPAFGNLATFDI